MELKYKFLAGPPIAIVYFWSSLHIIRLHCENACAVNLKPTQQILDHAVSMMKAVAGGCHALTTQVTN